MFNWLFRRSRRHAMRELIAELYVLNERDQCFDPIGSIDRLGMSKIIEVIARGKQTEDSRKTARAMFKLVPPNV